MTKVTESVRQLLDDNLDIVSSEVALSLCVRSSDLAHVQLGPAAAHAALWWLDHDPRDKLTARALSEQFLVKRGTPRAAGALRSRLHLANNQRFWDVRESIEVGSTLGWIAQLLEPSDAARLEPVIAAAMNAVIRGGGLQFYVNGNYAIPQVELAWFARLLIPRGEEAYERCWELLVNPQVVGRRWEGYGWIPDGDGGYFSETPGRKRRRPTNTFDTEYTLLQVDRMARLWLATSDDRALDYLRRLHRHLWRLVDPTTWTLDGRGGSRRNQVSPFYNAGTAILAQLGEVPLEQAEEQVATAVAGGLAYDPEHFDAYRMRAYGFTVLSLLLYPNFVSDLNPAGLRSAGHGAAVDNEGQSKRL